MASTTMDLSDDQIDKLLAEAESRLAAGGSQTTALVPQNTAVIAAASTTITPVAGQPTTAPKEEPKQAKELTVRVPKPAFKNKHVCFPQVICYWLFCPVFMMKIYPIF